MVPVQHYLIVSALLFAIGSTGLFFHRNLVSIFLCIELMLNAEEDAYQVGVVLFAVLGTVVARTSPAVPDETMDEAMRGTAARLGEFLLTDYLAPFEATAILILVSLVGATWLVRR